MTPDPPVTDKSRLLFGAGFVFGVAFTMLILGVVTTTVTGPLDATRLGGEVAISIAAAVVFAAIVGGSMYFLAFPENRVEVPIPGVDETAGEERSSGDGR